MSPYGYCKTEAAFVGWLRSAMRKVWTQHPARLELLKKNRRRLLNKSSGRMAFQNQCDHCKKWHVASKMEVNHKNTVGTCSLATFGTFAERLMLVTVDDLELLCTDCHAIVTYSERSGMNIEDAAIEKKVIAFFKKYNAAEQKEKFIKAGLEPAKTIPERKEQMRKYFHERKPSHQTA